MLTAAPPLLLALRPDQWAKNALLLLPALAAHVLLSVLHAFRAALLAQQRHGVTSYLAVLKRHRADNFAGSYSADGFSLALDFPVRPRRLDRLLALCRDFDAIRAVAGGRIYAAKDAVSRGRLPDVQHPLFSSNLVPRWKRERGAAR